MVVDSWWGLGRRRFSVLGRGVRIECLRLGEILVLGFLVLFYFVFRIL